MTTQRFYRRRFLNLRGFHAGAYLLASCRIDSFRRKGHAPTFNVDADFVVADCGRIVTLDFSVYDESGARNSLHKARVLRDAMIDFTDALEASIDGWRAASNRD